MEQIKFYQNNPCVIIRDVNDQFCEIQLNTHFAANIEASSYMTPSECRAPNSSYNEDEYDSISYLLEEIQEEEHSIICMVEKRLLHDEPVEMCTIISLQKDIDKQREEFLSTKELHEEWRNSAKSLKSQVVALQTEIEALNLSRSAEFNLRNTAKAGVKKLSDEYNSMIIEIQDYSRKNQQISKRDYNKLISDQKILEALKAGGVDNWEWYGESLQNAKIEL